MKHLFIYGIGGAGREALSCFVDICANSGLDYKSLVSFVVDDEFYSESTVMEVSVVKRSEIKNFEGEVIVAIGDPLVRERIVKSLPDDTNFAILIHPKANISKWVTIGKGTYIGAGTVITTQITIGKHVYINLNSTIGHDCVLEDFVTLSQGVNISGNCFIEEGVFIGSNSALRQKIRICSGTVIGMSSCVIHSIKEKGTFAGNPAKKIN